ncbi:YIP1 family protein [Thermoclostridium stercorarium]|nr:YIP1 family protein [Thermoclostridium stercorarium]
MVQFVPTEFTNMDIDEDGFIYAVSADNNNEDVKRLNAQGIDILRRDGYVPPGGDFRYTSEAGPPRLTDIDVTDCEIYSVLDAKRGRIFTYNGDGYLLYVFGGLGNRVGEFDTPVAIERINDNFLILDKVLGEITVFEPTEYGRVVNEAIRSYYHGNEEKAAEMFTRAVHLNANFEYAYGGIGKAFLRKGDYTSAVEHFKESMDRRNYSKAYVLYRREELREYFPLLMTLLCILVLCTPFIKKFIWPKIRRSPLFAREELRYPLRLMVHPYDGYWELKYGRNKRVNLIISFVILALLCITKILQTQYNGFLVNYNNPREFNSVLEIVYVVLPVLFWCIANWSLTTLMDGEGKFSEIFMSTCFALLPLILIGIPWIILSNYISAEEATFYYFSRSVAALWCLYLLFVGNMTIHQFTPSKTVGTMIVTVGTIGFLAFLCLLFFNLIQQLLSFAVTIIKEILLRF